MMPVDGTWRITLDRRGRHVAEQFVSTMSPGGIFPYWAPRRRFGCLGCAKAWIAQRQERERPDPVVWQEGRPEPAAAVSTPEPPPAMLQPAAAAARGARRGRTAGR
jgi:hypothetical protein